MSRSGSPLSAPGSRRLLGTFAHLGMPGLVYPPPSFPQDCLLLPTVLRGDPARKHTFATLVNIFVCVMVGGGGAQDQLTWMQLGVKVVTPAWIRRRRSGLGWRSSPPPGLVLTGITPEGSPVAPSHTQPQPPRHFSGHTCPVITWAMAH